MENQDLPPLTEVMGWATPLLRFSSLDEVQQEAEIQIESIHKFYDRLPALKHSWDTPTTELPATGLADALSQLGAVRGVACGKYAVFCSTVHLRSGGRRQDIQRGLRENGLGELLATSTAQKRYLTVPSMECELVCRMAADIVVSLPVHRLLTHGEGYAQDLVLRRLCAAFQSDRPLRAALHSNDPALREMAYRAAGSRGRAEAL